MFTTGQQVIDCISKRTKRDYGLSQFRAFMKSIGDPQYRLSCIHIGGTNGKGSTTDFLRSILQAQGYRVGTFTSPHLESHHDRIRIDDIPIADEDLMRLANRYQADWEAYGLTMFEIDMLISVIYFLEHEVDFALYEVGLGGELDATNIIDPLVSVITTIGFDHMEYLGNTIESIAAAKAGIIKPRRPLITHERKSSCLAVFAKACEERQAAMTLVKDAEQIEVESDALSFRYEGHRYRISTKALYQIDNACNAVETIRYLQSIGIAVYEQAIQDGLWNSRWKGRFEKVHEAPDVYVDGAHNEHGVQALKATLQTMHEPLTIVFAALKDKETDAMLRMLLDVTEDVIVTEFDFYRVKAARDIAADFPVEIICDWHEAIEQALTRGHTVIITGSLYFISDVRHYFKERGDIV